MAYNNSVKMAEWREKNKEKMKAYLKAYYAKHRDSHNAARKEWRRKNRRKYLSAKKREYRKLCEMPLVKKADKVLAKMGVRYA